MKYLVVVITLVLGGGCVFEPECDSYEACIADQTTNNSTDQNNATTSSNNTNNTTTPTNNGSSLICRLDACPDADQIRFGAQEEPLGCDRFGELEFFGFVDEASVCAGRPRGYRLEVRSCDSPYILEVILRPTSACVPNAVLDFDFPGFACGQSNTRCDVSSGKVIRSFLIDPDSIMNGEVLLEVDATMGGYDYTLEIESRR